MKTIFGLVSLFAFTAAVHAASPPASDKRNIEAEVTRVDASRVDALLKGDLKALKELFSDDMVYIHAAGRIDSKQPYLAMLAAGNLTYVSLRYDPSARVVAVGPDTALVNGARDHRCQKQGRAGHDAYPHHDYGLRPEADWLEGGFVSRHAGAIEERLLNGREQSLAEYADRALAGVVNKGMRGCEPVVTCT